MVDFNEVTAKLKAGFPLRFLYVSNFLFTSKNSYVVSRGRLRLYRTISSLMLASNLSDPVNLLSSANSLTVRSKRWLFLAVISVMHVRTREEG